MVSGHSSWHFRGKVDANFLFHGWRGSFGSCGNMEDGSGSISPWQRLLSTTSFDPRPRGLGARPRPMGVQRWHISFLGMSIYFGSFQSLCAMESTRTWGRWCLAASDPGSIRRRPMHVTSASIGSRGLFVISIFSRPLCAIRLR
jgi:hypothetical protein